MCWLFPLIKLALLKVWIVNLHLPQKQNKKKTSSSSKKVKVPIVKQYILPPIADKKVKATNEGKLPKSSKKAQGKGKGKGKKKSSN